jgi:hypothetical protein
MARERLPVAPQIDPDSAEALLQWFRQQRLPDMIPPARLARVLQLRRQRAYELIHLGCWTALRLGPKQMRVLRSSVEDWILRGGAQ